MIMAFRDRDNIPPCPFQVNGISNPIEHFASLDLEIYRSTFPNYRSTYFFEGLQLSTVRSGSPYLVASVAQSKIYSRAPQIHRCIFRCEKPFQGQNC